MQGMSPLHTHDDSDSIHVESSVERDYTLGEFLNGWGGFDAGSNTVKVTADGQPVSDWKNHILKENRSV